MSDKTANVAENAGPGRLSHLCDKEWQELLEKDDRTSPAEYPDMALITRNEFGAVMCEAFLLAKEKPDPNPDWEARAAAAHVRTLEENGVQPADTLAMLERWKSDAEPANELGQVSFSRAMLDSAADALRAVLEALKPFAEIRLIQDQDPSGIDGIDAPDLAITPRQVRIAREMLKRF